MKTVWPDTFVEETNLTRNIFSIRRALGEGSENQYIVTVSGKGYRLAQNAIPVRLNELNVVSAVRSTIEVEVQEERKKNRPRWIAVATAIVLAGAGAAYLLLHRTSRLTETDTIVIADFSNGTNDPVFDQTLTQGLAVELEQSPFLQIVSDQRVQHTLQLMNRQGGERLTPSLAREVCERISATVVLEGSISTLGNEYVLGLRATRCGSGDRLDAEQTTARTKEQVLDALTLVARRFRRRAGESIQTRTKLDKPLEEVTTGSLNALKAYSAGLHATMTESLVAGIPLQKRAIDLDPNFALAYAQLALAYADSGQTGPAIQAATRANELRNRASDRERFLIGVIYDRVVTGNFERARQTCMSWAQTYSRDPVAHAMASGLILQGLGDFDASIEEAKKALGLDPDFGPAYTNLAYSYFLEDRMKEATSVVTQAAGRGLESPEMIVLRYAIAFAAGDAEGMKQAAAFSINKPWAEDWMIQTEALAAADRGQIRVARQLSRKARALAVSVGQPERAAGYESAFAVDEALFGYPREAIRAATEALLTSHARDVEYTAALAGQRIGDWSTLAGRHGVLGMTLDDIDRKRRTITVRLKGARDDHRVLVADDFWPLLEKYLDAERRASQDIKALWIAARKGHGKPLCYATFESSLRYIARKAGVAVHPHLFRHTLAQGVLDTTGNIKVAQEILGHAHLSTTADLYMRVDQHAMVSALAAARSGADRIAAQRTQPLGKAAQYAFDYDDETIAELERTIEQASGPKSPVEEPR